MILPIIQAATLKVRLETPLLDEQKKKVNSDEYMKVKYQKVLRIHNTKSKRPLTSEGQARISWKTMMINYKQSCRGRYSSSTVTDEL